MIINVNDTFSDSAVAITRRKSNEVVTTLPSGISIYITQLSGILNFVASLPPSSMGQTIGLLGNFNGNDRDDFIYPNGTMLDGISSERMIHDLGQACEYIVVSQDKI